MQNIDEKKTKIRCFLSALIAKIDIGVLLSCQALRDHHESLTVSEWLFDISQDDLSCSEEAGETSIPVAKIIQELLPCVLCQ